ncbi:MAG: glycosyltransferase [Chitinispirillaceae bacterium]|jgi:glycosyltransferase involved in cell wall biosynthesis
MKQTVIIDPTARILYSAFYIKGLYDVFGRKNISFSAGCFRELQRRGDPDAYDHYLAFVVVGPGGSTRRYIVDFRDHPTVKERAYGWCDRYAKINFNERLTDRRYHGKMAYLPPSFGIRIWNSWETKYYYWSNLLLSGFSPLVSTKRYREDYLVQRRRPTLEDYAKNAGDKRNAADSRPYVFMIGTLWPHKNGIEGTTEERINVERKTFIDACKALRCNFEGGFFAHPGHPQYEEYKEVIFSNRYPVEQYLEKTKLSAVVYNTPAVGNCHGWKLGEYLAMGKAIISTPLSNRLPEKLIHGKNIHIVSNKDEIQEAVDLLLKNDGYRKSLEQGAKAYYEKHVSPEKVIEHIVET